MKKINSHAYLYLGGSMLLAVAVFLAGHYTAPNIGGPTVLMASQGGTGTSTKPTANQVLLGTASGTYSVVNTSSLLLVAVESDPVWTATNSNYLVTSTASNTYDLILKPLLTNSSAATLNSGNYFVKCNAASGQVTTTLPTASGISGKVYSIKKTDSTANYCVIDTTSSQTIDGSLTLILTTPSSSVTLISDGSNWLIQ